ncbi:MAG: hypothetical protein WCE70_00050 [Rhodanobacteraceae bacterium]
MTGVDAESLRKRYPAESRVGADDSIGLALAGGGTRAFDFAIGVIDGLVASGLAGHIDYISSVSGGSSAAYYLYSRLLNDKNSGFPHPPWFADCIPGKYAPLVCGVSAFRDKPRPCNDSSTNAVWSRQICPYTLTNWVATTAEPRDPLRYQNFLRSHQIVFSVRCNYAATTEVNATNFLIGPAIETALYAPANLLSNLLFDQRRQLSPTYNLYKTGINRNAGAEPAMLYRDLPPQLCRSAKSHKAPTFAEIRGITGQSASLLCDGMKDDPMHPCRVPVWIINTTLGISGCVLDLFCEPMGSWARTINGVRKVRLENAVFEFTPYAYGSDAIGYVDLDDKNEALNVEEAVTASSAFFDSQQRDVGKGLERAGLGILLRSFLLNWGTDIGNYTIPADEFERRHNNHALLPFPFYLLDRYRKDNHALYLHLSDAGQSDNTGIFSLLRRGVRTIIFVDEGSDRKGQFVDLCRLRGQLLGGALANLKLDINVPALTHFHEVCDQTLNAETRLHPIGYPMFAWSNKVLEGNVSQVLDPGERRRVTDTRLLIIKPGLNFSAAAAFGNLAEIAGVCSRNPIQFLTTAQTPTVVDSPCVRLIRKRDCNAKGYLGYPCEILGYVAIQETAGAPAGIARDGFPYFPQLATTNITTLSSPWIFGAYRELGAFMANGFRLRRGRIMPVMQHPIEPCQLQHGSAGTCDPK